MRWLLIALFSLLTVPASAHSITTSVMRLKQVSANEFMASWESLEGLHDPQAAYLVLRPRFPAQCELTPPKLRCDAAGLSGRIVFDGLATFPNATVILQVHRLGAPVESYVLTGTNPVASVQPGKPEKTPWTRTAASFTRIGIEHIWLGFDHLAFVLGLLWLVQGRAMLVKTITAFTLAHSLTLGAATLGFRPLAGPPVEAAIALSIAFVAVELVKRTRNATPGLTSRAPWWVAFCFGLLHGFGFAGALSEIQINPDQLLVSLTFFNIGVELGQLVFVAAVSLVGLGLRRLEATWQHRALSVAHYAMGSLAMYWVVERVLSF